MGLAGIIFTLIIYYPDCKRNNLPTYTTSRTLPLPVRHFLERRVETKPMVRGRARVAA